MGAVVGVVGLLGAGMVARNDVDPSADPPVAMRRTVATLLGGLLLQGDRWIIGAVGGPAVLATYELAWRIAFCTADAVPEYDSGTHPMRGTNRKELHGVFANTTTEPVSFRIG